MIGGAQSKDTIGCNERVIAREWNEGFSGVFKASSKLCCYRNKTLGIRKRDESSN